MTSNHRRRFGAAMDEFRERRGEEPDRAWRALLLLATAPVGLWERVRPHVDWDALSVAFPDIPLTTPDEARLLTVAANLLYGRGAVDVADLADNMDGTLWRVVMLAWEEYEKRGGRK